MVANVVTIIKTAMIIPAVNAGYTVLITVSRVVTVNKGMLISFRSVQIREVPDYLFGINFMFFSIIQYFVQYCFAS